MIDESIDYREKYLAAATYLSSRAFPSTVLSPKPTLQPGPTSEPVLLPGVDLFDHARESRVTWLVSQLADGTNEGYTSDDGGSHRRSPGLSIGLVLHSKTELGKNLFNNYGAKPNAELILGYGFTLPRNPDDTIVLKIGGMGEDGEGKKWEVGRNAEGTEAMWNEILRWLAKDGEPGHAFEEELDASEMLVEMTQALLDRLPEVHDGTGLRPDVAVMRDHYVEGLCSISGKDRV